MSKTALLLVDIQNDFLPPGGSLAAPEGDEILEHVYRLVDEGSWNLIVASQDYHPKGHVSFASTHSKSPFTTKAVPKLHAAPDDTITQMLWPDHCIQGTHGCEFESGLKTRLGDKAIIIQKGCNVAVDAYSAFADNQYTLFTPLARVLHSHDISTIVMCGLATDYCVRATAIDARKFGFKTLVVREAISAVDPSASDKVLDELKSWGCEIINIQDALQTRQT